MDSAVDPRSLHWMRKPSLYTIDGEKVILETEPHTSFHALSFQSTDAFGMTFDPLPAFAFTVRLDYAFNGESDECGILLRKSDTRWAKVSIENRIDDLDLAATVYENGYGDRSCRSVGQAIRWMYLRLLYWNGNARFQFSFNGDRYNDLRWLHFVDSCDMVQAGIYACSPNDSYFDCKFSCMHLRVI